MSVIANILNLKEKKLIIWYIITIKSYVQCKNKKMASLTTSKLPVQISSRFCFQIKRQNIRIERSNFVRELNAPINKPRNEFSLISPRN